LREQKRNFFFTFFGVKDAAGGYPFRYWRAAASAKKSNHYNISRKTIESALCGLSIVKNNESGLFVRKREGRIFMNNENGLEKQKLLIELENIQNRGIAIFLDGIPSSPLTVTDALCVKDSSNFMRDYVTDEKGVLRELRFDEIRSL
jgi:hypothetical protein